MPIVSSDPLSLATLSGQLSSLPSVKVVVSQNMYRKLKQNKKQSKQENEYDKTDMKGKKKEKENRMLTRDERRECGNLAVVVNKNDLSQRKRRERERKTL